MVKKDIAGTAQGANPAVKEFVFTVSKITETKNNKYCITLEKEGIAVKSAFGTLSTETVYNLFLKDHNLAVGASITLNGKSFDSALLAEGLRCDTITDPDSGKVQKRLTAIVDDEE